MKRIGMLTSGGDCQALNAAMRGVVKTLANGKEEVEIYAVEQVENAVFLDNFKPEYNKKYALIMGNEVFGVNQEAIKRCDGAIEIPQLGTKHSLNVSVSAGIVIWDLFCKLKNQ